MDWLDAPSVSTHINTRTAHVQCSAWEHVPGPAAAAALCMIGAATTAGPKPEAPSTKTVRCV